MKRQKRAARPKAVQSVRKTTNVCNSYQRDALVRQSIITLAVLHKFVYEFRENNTCIIQDRTALGPGKLTIDFFWKFLHAHTMSFLLLNSYLWSKLRICTFDQNSSFYEVNSFIENGLRMEEFQTYFFYTTFHHHF